MNAPFTRVRGRAWRTHALVLLAYTLAALILTWPLARYVTTHVPGDGIDDPSLAWNLWWIKARLIDQLELDIFRSGWMFHPVGINLAFYTLTPLNGLLSLPLQSALGLVIANNVLLLSTFVLGGYGMFLLARQSLGHGIHSRPALAAAFAAGFLYAFAAPKLFYVSLGQFNIAGSHWIPFCALYAVRLLHARDTRMAARDGALAGLFLVMQAWVELTYASFLLLFFTLVFAAALIQIARRRAQLRTLAAGFGAASLLFLLGMAPILWAMLPDLRVEGDFFGSGGGFADLYSADLAGFLMPTRLHPLVGAAIAALPFPNDKGQQIFLGYLALLLALIGIGWFWQRRRGRALFWTVGVFGFWLLSLGPSLRWMGRDLAIPGPFALVSLLPFFNGNRYPSRYAVMILLCLGVLVAAGLYSLLRRLHGRRRAVATAGVLLLFTAEAIAVPLPLSDFRIPPIYARLAAESGDRALLELPTGWRNGARVLGKSDVLIMMQQWNQTAHAKRRLGGNTSRNPAHKFQFFTEHPLMGDLIALMNADRDDMRPVIETELESMIARHTPVAVEELADLGVGWVTLHEEKSPPALIRFVEEALPLALIERWKGLDWSGAPATIRLYRVASLPSTSIRTLPLAETGGAAWLAEGWSAIAAPDLRYTNRPRAGIVVPLPEGGATLTLAPASPEEAPAAAVNGIPLIPLPLSGDSLVWLLPAGVADQPVDRLTLSFTSGAPVTSLATTSMAIGSTGAAWPASRTLVVRSAGEETGDFAEIWLDGVSLTGGARGYNLAAIDESGSLLEAAHFDTFATEEESARMAAWLRRWPGGTRIAGAVADEASLHLTQEAIDALRSVGVAGDLRGQFRAAHAFIGVGGAPPGTALEQINHLRPAAVWLGAPVDGSSVFGGYATLMIEPLQ